MTSECSSYIHNFRSCSQLVNLSVLEPWKRKIRQIGKVRIFDLIFIGKIAVSMMSHWRLISWESLADMGLKLYTHYLIQPQDFWMFNDFFFNFQVYFWRETNKRLLGRRKATIIYYSKFECNIYFWNIEFLWWSTLRTPNEKKHVFKMIHWRNTYLGNPLML